jgi:tRNA A-37 threonylcarbamoyl transferase component Bud32
MLVDEPVSTKRKESVRSGSAEQLEQDLQWQGESQFPYPPARGNLVVTYLAATVYFFCWTILFYSVSSNLVQFIMGWTPSPFNALLTCAISVSSFFYWIYVPILWMYKHTAECFDWKIRIGRTNMIFPPKIRPRDWQSGLLPACDVSMVLLVSDKSKRVPYDIDEDRRCAHMLVFKRAFWGDATLQLDEMTKTSRDQFLLALSRLLPQEKLSTELQDEIESLEAVLHHKDLDVNTVKGKQHVSPGGPKDGQNFTRWWHQDLEKALLATNYVPLSPGHSLQAGRFVIDDYLASGGQSTTYLSHAVDGTQVVVKESVVAEIVDQSIREKAHELFSREARLLMICNHPRIARILDHFTENSRDYLVTEFIEGRTLRQVVCEDGRQTEALVLKWAQSIVELFVYLHSLEPPIIHRDISPDNLILSQSNDIFLIDFGAANDTIGNLTGTMIGKQSYMAPEQFRGKAVPASDIYAFGGTLFFLITGKDPVPLSVCHLNEATAQSSRAMDELLAACTSQGSETRPDGLTLSILFKNWAAVEAPLLKK